MTPSTTPLTIEGLFAGEDLIQRELDARIVPERYLAKGTLTAVQAASLLAQHDDREWTVVDVTTEWNVFTAHAEDCFNAQEEQQQPGLDLSAEEQLCTCAASELLEYGVLMPVSRTVPGPHDGALAVTWISAESVPNPPYDLPEGDWR